MLASIVKAICLQRAACRPLPGLFWRQEGHFNALFVVIVRKEVYLHGVECLPWFSFERITRVEGTMRYVLGGQHCVHVAFHELLLRRGTLPRCLGAVCFIALFRTRLCLTVVACMAIIISV